MATTQLIFDVGMAGGEDTAYYLHRGYRVVGIEAHAGLARECAERFASAVRDGQLIIENVGIAESRGTMPFYISTEPPFYHSFDRQWASRNGKEPTEIAVPTVPITDLIDKHGIPYYMKVDIEGNDDLIVEQLDPARKPKLISIETSNASQIELLASKGYTKFKCISQRLFLPVQTPPSLRERLHVLGAKLRSARGPIGGLFRKTPLRRVAERMIHGVRRRRGWEFQMGSSGPFGDDLCGRWLDAAEMIATHRQCEERRARGESSLFWNADKHSFWTDFHATW